MHVGLETDAPSNIEACNLIKYFVYCLLTTGFSYMGNSNYCAMLVSLDLVPCGDDNDLPGRDRAFISKAVAFAPHLIPTTYQGSYQSQSAVS
jgi:hypothetical protein